MFATLMALALATQAAQPVRNPRHWPTPMMDSVAPTLPKLRAGAVLVLTKTNGFRDPDQIAAATRALQEIVRAGGRDVFVTENAAVMNASDLARFRVVVLASTSGTIFTEPQRSTFRAWIERGGGVVLLHGAGGDNRYDWNWYRDALLGALFIGHTSHPEQFQRGDIHIVAPDHPVMRGLPARWTRVEEWYAFDRVPSGSGTRIQATLDEASYRPPSDQRMGAVHPMIWTRCVARGRTIFSALGHRPESYHEPLHRRLIGNAIAWAAGRSC